MWKRLWVRRQIVGLKMVYTCVNFGTFTLFNLRSSVIYGKVHQYADDRQVCYSFKPEDWRIAKRYIGTALEGLTKFLRQHKLQNKPEKPVILFFGEKKQEIINIMQINMQGNQFTYSNCVRNLGLMMDTDLRFREHVKLNIRIAYGSLNLSYPHPQLTLKQL